MDPMYCCEKCPNCDCATIWKKMEDDQSELVSLLLDPSGPNEELVQLSEETKAAVRAGIPLC